MVKGLSKNLLGIIALSFILSPSFAFSGGAVEPEVEVDKHFFLVGIATSFVAAFIFLPFQSIFYWLNSRLMYLYQIVRWGGYGLKGSWLAIYTLPDESIPRYETVKILASFDKEARGTIQAWKSGKTYQFAGKIIGNEMVAHYWLKKHGEKDSGSFKIILNNNSRIAKGNLIYYDSNACDDKKTGYIWRKWNKTFFERIRDGIVRIDTSTIDDQGVISQTFFVENERIGSLSKKYVAEQGKHTLEVDNKHYLIMEPWSYLNHSCKPNAQVKIESNKLAIVAIKEIFPEDEITFDYCKYEKKVSKKFICKCPHCINSDSPYIFEQR